MNRSKEYFKRKAKTEEKGNSSTYIVMLKALIMCFIITFVMVMLYALVLSLTTLADSSMQLVIQTIVMISIVCASIYGGKRTHKNGWVFGLLLGLLYVFLLIPMGMLFGNEFNFDQLFIAKVLMGSIVGLVGGVIGVNLQ